MASVPVLLPATNDDRFRDEHPVWLADGRHILFARLEHRGERGVKTIWMMDDRGGDVAQTAGPLLDNDSFEGEFWFGYYGTID